MKIQTETMPKAAATIAQAKAAVEISLRQIAETYDLIDVTRLTTC